MENKLTLVTGQSGWGFYHTLRKLAHAIDKRFLSFKIENFQLKHFDIFLIFAQNIDCGYTLEPPCRGSSYEYPQSMFWSKNKKNRVGLPRIPQFFYIKVGFKGVYISRTCFLDVWNEGHLGHV